MGDIFEWDGEDVVRMAHLFDVYDYDRALIGSILERRQSGRIFCDAVNDPKCAVLFHLGHYAYVAGDVDGVHVKALIETIPYEQGVNVDAYELFVPEATWISALGITFQERLRKGGYAYTTFTDSVLAWIQEWPERVPEGMQLIQMNEILAQQAEEALYVATGETWDSFARFVAEGFGFVLMSGANLIGAISTFSIGEGLAEIDIAVRKDFRRQGLATLLGCAFVDHCLKNGLTPSWTANEGNLGSLATARKLGFVDRFVLPCFKIAKE